VAAAQPNWLNIISRGAGVTARWLRHHLDGGR